MLTFFHAPQSRSSSILWLLEELGVPYGMSIVDIRAETGVPEAYRTIQPHKKVPAIEHNGVVVTERAAICAYLTETFPEAELAPPPGDVRRGPFLSWLAYADGVIDPCITAKSLGWTYEPRGVSFGSFDDMVAHVEKTLGNHPYALGDQFTAVDTQLGSAIFYASLILRVWPDRPVFADYLKRVQARAGFVQMMAKDRG